MSQEVRIGIIGAGFARTTQVPGFQMCGGARVVSVASARRENAEAVAQRFGIEHVASDWRSVVDNTQVDLVSVVSPPATHAGITIAALQAGKAVLCEKPTAMNAAEAAAMRDCARESGRLALIDHELRFLPGRQKMREMLLAGEIGRVRHLRVTFSSDFRAGGVRPWNWWADASQGGGALGAIGSHAIDSLRWLLGAEVAEVACDLASHVRERMDPITGKPRQVTSDDEASLMIRMRDCDLGEGITAAVSLSLVEAGPNANNFEVFGSAGAMLVDDDGELFFSQVGEKRWTKIPTGHVAISSGMPANGWSRGFVVFARRIVEALRNGENSVAGAATMEDGYRIQVALDAARLANSERRWVSIGG